MRTAKEAFKEARDSGAIDAWLEGKTVQYNAISNNRGEGGWFTLVEDSASFSNPGLDWRIKAEPAWELGHHIPGFRPLQDGEEWGMAKDWLEEELPEGWRPLLHTEGATLEDMTLVVGTWEKVHGREGMSSASHSFKFKTQRPLPPIPHKLIPLEASDIPPGSHFRRKKNAAIWETCLHLIKGEIFLSDTGWHPFVQLHEDSWEILRPGSTEWLPCSKVSKEVEGGAGK